MNFKGDGYQRKYTKAVALSQEDFDWLDKVRGKKSKGGKLEEIIRFYREVKKLL